MLVLLRSGERCKRSPLTGVDLKINPREDRREITGKDHRHSGVPFKHSKERQGLWCFRYTHREIDDPQPLGLRPHYTFPAITSGFFVARALGPWKATASPARSPHASLDQP